jgi:hypothetical protein
VVLIADFVEAVPLQANPYTELRCRLLAAHQLTDIQQLEQLHQLPPLANQKLSELLAEMLRLCPRGQEKNAFFSGLFLNKLKESFASCSPKRIWMFSIESSERQLLLVNAGTHGLRNFKDTNPLMSSLLVILFGGGETIL